MLFKPEIKLELVNNASSIQVDIKADDEEFRIFLKTSDILKLINNHMCAEYSKFKVEHGYHQITEEINMDLIN